MRYNKLDTVCLIAFLAVALLTASAASHSSSTAGLGPPSAAPTATCQLYIQGGNKDGIIQQARLKCSPQGAITAVADQAWLARFADSLGDGVVQHIGLADPQCLIPGCLITICGDSRAIFTNSTIQGVQSQRDSLRLLCVGGNSSLVLHAARFINNTAKVLKITDKAKVTLTDCTFFNNTSSFLAGVAVSVHDNGKLRVDGNSSIVLNTARQLASGAGNSGGGLSADGNAHVTIAGSTRFANNYAVGGSGAGLIVGDHTSLVVTDDSVITSNMAVNASGGGLVVDGQVHVVISGNARIERNIAVERSGGGLVVAGSAFVVLSGNSVISGNIATSSDCSIPGMPVSSGGGVMVGGNATVLVTDHARVTGNNVMHGAGGGFDVGQYGTLILDGRSVVGNNSCISYLGGGLRGTQHSTVLIGGNVSFINNSALSGAVQKQGDDIAIYDHCVLQIAPGAKRQAQGVGAVDELSRCSSSVYLECESCSRGEYRRGKGCVCCPMHTYSLRSGSELCDACPAHAECPGGSVIYPLPGYFHSSALSTQVHRCPLFTEACGQHGICRMGYTGNLCGSCELPRFGMTIPLRCASCMRAQQQLALYVMLLCITVVFISITVHFTRKDNVEGNRQLRATDLIKVLVLFLQYLVIIGSISVPWPEFLRGLFRASSVVFGVSTGTPVSIDCWLFHYELSTALPLSVQRQLVYFIAPVVVLLAVVALDVFCWLIKRCYQRVRSSHCSNRHGRPYEVLRRLPVVVLVVGYYSYPSLVKASLALFACLRIDDASVGPHSEYAVLNSSTGYWVSDISKACFTGWHLVWSLALGLTGTLLFCVAVPLAIWCGLRANSHKCDVVSFREHFGFLYRNYHRDKVWWEAVWAVQTVVLTAISVFHFSLEAYYSMLLLALAHMLSLGLLVIFRPYMQPRLHRLHLVSTCCLFATTWGALALFTVDMDRDKTLDDAHLAIGVLVVLIDVIFVAWCLFCIVSYGNIFKVVCSMLKQLCTVLNRWCTSLNRFCHRLCGAALSMFCSRPCCMVRRRQPARAVCPTGMTV